MFWKKNSKKNQSTSENNSAAGNSEENSQLSSVQIPEEEPQQVPQVLPLPKDPDEFSLSIKNLNDIPFIKYKNDFTFIVNGKRFRTNRLIADILSPVIRESHFTDATINSFAINTIKDESNSNNTNQDDDLYFPAFLKLSQYDKQEILDETRRTRYYEYFYHLRNFDECFRIRPNFFKEITTENVIDQLLAITKMPLILDYITVNSNDLITFFAKNFEYINKDRLHLLQLDLIEKVLSNENLQLRDEDSLLRLLIDLYKKDNKYSCLFEYVIFKNVGETLLCSFMNDVEFEDINRHIWRLVCGRILPTRIASLNDQPDTSNRYLIDIQEFDHSGNDFNGIMRHLTNKVHENIHTHGTINISSNSISGEKNHPRNLVDYNSNNYYYSLDAGEATVCFDFKEMSVQLNSYSVKSYQSSNSAFLRNWVVEVSNDGVNWITIDRHKDDTRLKGSNLVANFAISNANNNNYYRYIQIRQTGNSWCDSYNHNYISIYCIEFYGKLKSPKK